LPPELLARLLASAPSLDTRVLLGPGIGLDCAVLDFGESLLVLKSDPITFAVDEIGWYALQVNANDIATTGATPRWFLMTLLLPKGGTTEALVEQIIEQVYRACAEMQVSVIGGHTEITAGLDRPILAGTLIGEVKRERLVTPCGAQPGDRLLVTKGVPIEATAILAREFPGLLSGQFSLTEIEQARAYLHDPGISVLREASAAVRAGRVTAMHDPTEGGLASALWELAEACGHTLIVDLGAVPIPELAGRACQAAGLDPLASIASGALLLTVDQRDAEAVRGAVEAQGILCVEFGEVCAGPAVVRIGLGPGAPLLNRPARDEIARLYEPLDTQDELRPG
jgi:hydrogenase expression/formation protein HypE